jgi:YVTN family beta-propeller protein
MLAAAGGLLVAILPPLAATSLAATATAPSPGYTASRIPVPGTVDAAGIAVDSATNTIYIGGGHFVTAVNGATGTVAATIPVMAFVQGIAVDAATNRVYVSEAAGSAVAVIDGATNTVLTTIPVVGTPTGIAVDSATNMVYVATAEAATVAVINGATNAVSTIYTGLGTHPLGVAVDESTDVVWVADRFGSLIEINGSNSSIMGRVIIRNGVFTSVAVNTATDTVYATDLRQGDVDVIDGQTGTLSTVIPAGVDVNGVAVDQSSGLSSPPPQCP